MSNDDVLGRSDAMVDVKRSFSELAYFLGKFVSSPHQKDTPYPDTIKEWRGVISVSSEFL